MANTKPYPYITAWGKYMGSRSYYIKDQIAKAQRADAPDDAYAEIWAKDGSGPTGVWSRMSEMPNVQLREQMIKAVEGK